MNVTTSHVFRKQNVLRGKIEKRYVAMSRLKFPLQISTVKHMVTPTRYALLVYYSKAWMHINDDITLSNEYVSHRFRFFPTANKNI